MPEELADALVKLSGTDLGFLSFEIQKAALHAEGRGVVALAPEDVKAAMAPIGEVSFDVVKVALATRNRKAVAKALFQIRKASKDPIMGLCGFLESLVIGTKKEKEGQSSFGWLHVVTKVAQGKTAEAIAADLNVKVARCQYFMIPEVRAWDTKSVLGILKATSAARRAVLTGQSDPWLVLVSRLLDVCRASTR
jgi:DNA polymerase III delta subunit